MRSGQRMISFLVGGSALALFVGLGAWVYRHPHSRLELAVTRRIQAAVPPWLGRLLGWISWLGFPPQSVLIPGTILTAFWFRGQHATARRLFLIWMASAVSFVTKRLVRRPRPNHPSIHIPIAQPRDASFPSGHVVTYTTFWLATFTQLAQRAPWGWLRVLLLMLAGILVGGVGLSRIYLGHHWLTDVLGGYLLGGGWYSLLHFFTGKKGSCSRIAIPSP